MYSVDLIQPELVRGMEELNIKTLLPHENVILKRQNALKEYLMSYQDYVVIPSIICCSDTKMIIDGHHRYHTLMQLGVKKVPVTLIDYKNINIRTHNDPNLKLEKNDIVKAALNGELLPPKSTIHQFMDSTLNWKPIILLSSLCEFKINLSD